MRRRRFRVVKRLLDQAADNTSRPVRIVDLGGALRYWALFPDLIDFSRIELVVANIAPRPTLHDELARQLNFRDVTYVVADATDTGFSDREFDLVHANSVIEHVGGWENMRKMADEVRRIGRGYYVQVPNIWFPFEPHFRSLFFHWMPEQVRARRLMRRSYAHFARAETMDQAMRYVEGVQLLDRAQMAALFPDASIVCERFVIPKSYMAVREPNATPSTATDTS